jgi:hypothetical protein
MWVAEVLMLIKNVLNVGVKIIFMIFQMKIANVNAFKIMKYCILMIELNHGYAPSHMTLV